MDMIGGFRNIGNTCFFNAAASLLVNARPLKDCCAVTETRHRNCVACAMGGYSQQILKGFSTFTPSRPLKLLRDFNPDFIKGAQHDSHEALMATISSCDHVKTHFAFSITEAVRCLSCSYVNEQDNQVLDLAVTIGVEGSLQDLVDSYFEDEELSDYLCPACGKSDSIKSARCSSSPPLLLLHLKRFDSSGQKLETQFAFDDDLKIHGDDYTLEGVVSHLGNSATSGHYISYVRCGKLWVRVNDDKVRAVDVNDVEQPYIMMFKLKESTIVLSSDEDDIPIKKLKTEIALTLSDDDGSSIPTPKEPASRQIILPSGPVQLEGDTDQQQITEDFDHFLQDSATEKLSFSQEKQLDSASELSSDDGVNLVSQRRRHFNISTDSDSSADDSEFYNDATATPFYKRSCVSDLKAIISIFKNLILKKKSLKTCSEVPYRCDKPASFLINFEKLACHEDVVCDGLGSFLNQSCDRYYLNAEFVRCDKSKHIYEIKSTYYNLKRDRSFKRRIVQIIKPNSGPLYALLTYSFKGDVHTLPDMPAHGNSKQRERAYTATKKSVRNSIAEEIGKVSYTQLHDKLFDAAGGMLRACNETDYPRGMKQIYDVKAGQCNNGKIKQTKDEIYDLILMKTDPNSYVLDVHWSQSCNMAITLASRYQLDMLQELCCSDIDPVIIGIDMTYNCGDRYYVTPTVIQHPMLIHTETLVEPAILGPTLIHTEHNDGVYRLFAGDLVNACPALSGVRFLGSDRQKELYNGFKVHMKQLKLLLCKRHVEQNIMTYLEKQGIPDASRNVIMDSIFKDLIECNSELEFETSLQQLKDMWDNVSTNLYNWFVRYQYDSFKTSLLKCHRDSAGLRGRHFFNNGCESINRLLKMNVTRKTTLSCFIEEWRQLVNSQENNLHRSIIQEGKYALKATYKSLQMSKTVYFKKSSEQRQKIFADFNRSYRNPRLAHLPSSVSITKTITSSVATKAGHKLSDNPRKRVRKSISAEFCIYGDAHSTSIIFKDRFNPQPKRGKPITKCYSCHGTYLPEEKVVACVLTYRQYNKDGKNHVSRTLQNVYVHLRCMAHKDFENKPVHICNYMQKVLTSKDVELIKRITGASLADS